MNRDRYIEYEKEIQIIKDELQKLEKRIDGIVVISKPQRDDINDYLESSWGLLEVQRHFCANLADLLGDVLQGRQK